MYLTVNNVDIFFDVLGPQLDPVFQAVIERPTLVVLHGGPGTDHTGLRPWLDPLSRVAQVIVVDHRNHGRSERGDLSACTIDQLADDLEELRRGLGISRWFVLGHSFGGMVAQVYAIKHPEATRGLILSNTTPSHQFWDDAQQIAEGLATPEQKAVLPLLFEGRLKTQQDYDHWWSVCRTLYYFRPDPQVIEGRLGRSIENADVAAYMMQHEVPRFDVRGQLPRCRVPSLILAGRHDWVTPPSQSEVIHRLLPDSHLVVFEDSGHLPHIEQNAEYLEAITDYVRHIELGSPS